ncbi:MAG: hypothetical protein ACRD0C_20070 [Acidimicrobiia bacterium]
MSLPQMNHDEWCRAAHRVHMILSGALPDEELDRLSAGSETRRPVPVIALRAA